jgi:hypothetical protein
VPRGWFTSWHARRSLIPCSPAWATAQRRRSGLRSFPRRYLQDQLVQAQLPHQTLQLRVLLLKFLQPPRLVHLQPTEFLSPAVLSLLRDAALSTGCRRGLAVRNYHFNLPKQAHDLLRRMLLSSCIPGSSHTSLSHSHRYKIRRALHYLPVYHLTACSGIHCLAVDRVSGVLRAANDALCLRYRLPGVMDNEQELVRLQGCVVL